MIPYYETIPVRPDGLGSWEEHRRWYLSLPPNRYDLWLEFGNDDDGIMGNHCPAGTIVDGRRIGIDQPKSQDLFEWWVGRNKWHNKNHFVEARPVVNPIYTAGRPPVDDWRFEVNNFYVNRTNPPFFKLWYFFYGYRSDKPSTPPPPWWVPRPVGGYGGAYDKMGFKRLHFP